MITAALEGDLANVEFTKHDVFGLQMPNTCPNVPVEILHPRNTWSDKDGYDDTANKLAAKFVANFEKFASDASSEIMEAAPVVNATV
jgi:phosphoenolpyruvate carboxykinase (ATP)